MSFPIVLRRMIGLKDFRELYDSLLGLKMTMDIEILKWKGQWPNSKYMSAMLIILLRHTLFLTILLRCLHDSLFGPGTNELLHLAIELINSSSKKETYIVEHSFGISFNAQMSICWPWAVLNNEWRACQRSSISKQDWPLYLIASTAESLCLLTQFMSSNGSHFLLAISWILRSKKECLVDLTIFLNCFQFSIHLDDLYFSKSLL